MYTDIYKCTYPPLPPAPHPSPSVRERWIVRGGARRGGGVIKGAGGRGGGDFFLMMWTTEH